MMAPLIGFKVALMSATWALIDSSDLTGGCSSLAPGLALSQIDVVIFHSGLTVIMIPLC